jgi:hypothetical protein
MARAAYYESLKSFWESVGVGVFCFIVVPIPFFIIMAIIGLILHYVFGVDPVYELGGYTLP